MQLPPTQPSGIAIHAVIKEFAIAHGANPDDPWNAENSKQKPEWPKHLPTNYVTVVTETCDCQRTDAIKSRLRRLLDSGEVPPKHQGRSFDTWMQLPEHKRAGLKRMYEACRWLASNETAPEPDGKFGVVLSGPVGIGKTSLAACVLMERARRGQAVMFIDFNDMLNQARKSQRPDTEVHYDEIVGAAGDIPFLLIDDMGDMARRAEITDFTRELVYDIIRKRFDFLRETIITTNLTAEQFQEMFDDRIYRRVHGMEEDDGMCFWLEPTN